MSSSEEERDVMDDVEREEIVESSSSIQSTSRASSFDYDSLRGPKSADPIWNFFESRKENKELWTYCKICSYKNKGRNNTNVKKHLKRTHKAEALEYEQKRVKFEKEKETAGETFSKVSISDYFKKLPSGKVKLYDRKSPKYQEIKMRLTFLAGSTSFAHQLVDTEEFQSFMTSVNEQFPLPTGRTLSSWVIEVSEKLKRLYQAKIKSAERFSVCIDLWTQHGFTFSYMGMTGHFYDSTEKKLESVCLGCSVLPHPHTAEAIFSKIQAVLESWGLEDAQVLRYVTDEGANIKAALRDLVVVQTDVIENAEEDVEVGRPADFRLEDSDIEDEDDEQLQSNAREMDRVFSRRLSCYAHVVSSACRTVLDKEGSPIYELKAQVLPLVSKFTHSGAASENLKRLAGKKLLKVAQHRWNSFFYVCNRLVDLRAELTQVCQEKDWPIRFQWADVQLCRDFLKPFADKTTLLEGQKYPTAPGVIPAILTLLEHLDVSFCDIFIDIGLILVGLFYACPFSS